MNALRAYMVAKEALQIARETESLAQSALQQIGAIATGGSGVLSAVASQVTGAYSPEGVVTGYVRGQIFNQISGPTLDVTQVWRFEGTVGNKTGWVAA